MTDGETPTRKAPDEDSWVATLRRNREAAELIRQRLAEEALRPLPPQGVPCE